MTALAKLLAICAGTVGGAAACVATGVVPAPLLDPPEHRAASPAKVAHHQRHRTQDLTTAESTTYEPAPPTEAQVEPDPQPQEAQASHEEEERKAAHQARTEEARAPVEEAIAATPPSESGATEYTEAAPVTSEASSAASSAPSSGGGSSGSASSGSAAGEFGP